MLRYSLSFSGDILKSHPLVVSFPRNSVAFICLLEFSSTPRAVPTVFERPWRGRGRRLRFLNLRAGSASYGDHFSRALNTEKLILRAHTHTGPRKTMKEATVLGKRGG